MGEGTSAADLVAEELSAWEGTLGDFVARLDRRGVEFLSYTKLSAVKFCEQRYRLEYVEGVEPRWSAGLAKGRVFHEVAARLCGRIEEDGWDLEGVDRLISKELDEEDGRHLRNAVELLIENLPSGYRVVAIEEPFVLDLGEGLPPLLGVIDLVLEKGGTYLVIDHKTGKKFYDQDDLQLRLYREHVCRAYEPARCLMAYDEYRWVNDLARIRVPAFRRNRVPCGRKTWGGVVREIRRTYKAIARIQGGGHASADGPCYMCPVSGDCDYRTERVWY